MILSSEVASRIFSVIWVISANLAHHSISGLRILQMSDLHIDTAYSQNGSIAQRCHAGTVEPVGSTTSVAGVPPTQASARLGPMGDYACDPPYALFRSALRAILQLEPKPDVIIWTGDSNPHWVDGPNFDYIYPNLRNISQELLEAFPNTTIVPALGNHDTYKPDDYPDFKRNNTYGFYSNYIEQGSWGDFIPSSSRETFKLCGYYTRPLIVSSLANASLLAIVLNTNIYYYNRLPLDEEDPCGQLGWLENQLTGLGKEQKVIILGHVPPGFFELDLHHDHPMFSVRNGQNLTRRFQEIVSRPVLAEKIVAHFFGHTHTDSFRLIFPLAKGAKISDKTSPHGLIFICPSITPSLYLDNHSHGVNPSFRFYSYNQSTAVIDNYLHYYLPLDQVPLSSDVAFTPWKLAYNAQEAFGTSSLSTDQMFIAYNTMKSYPESDIFRDYVNHNTVLHSSSANKTCVDQCHVNMVCTITNLLAEDLKICLGMNATKNNKQETSEESTTITSESPKTSSDITIGSKEDHFTGEESNHFLRGILVGFSIICIIGIAIAGLIMYRHLRRNRYRSEEFLLTDGVFKCNGYSEIEEWS
ncbi:hypothetical protein TCAL_14599 [Tigriopus californicus]|uniref:Uncharacterized protein n=1 Tax=Tigriopus californicus TaxID=6832 RepID=A0A553PD77_TIGCA|nr:acid sphingomyelinase-like phosphodiesterase 3b [Tigriopus californicus]TRY75626.1 hypothetical protein TCAL_14599 [Tigriopus californicus]